MGNVVITIVNSAGKDSALADPFISMLGTCNGKAQNFNISPTGVCTPQNMNLDGSIVIQLSKLKGPLLLDEGLIISSGRIYFSTNAEAVTTAGVNAVTAGFYYDWIEFALNSGANKQLVVNTTQVDQFGFPIVLSIEPPDENFGGTAGICLERETLFTNFKTQLPKAYLDCLFPVDSANKSGDNWRILSPNLAMIQNTKSTLASSFVKAIDDFFSFYSTNKLYLNADSAFPYKGQVTTVSQIGTDKSMHDYAVLQFKFATDAPVNPGIIVPPSTGSGPYNIYYPFFTTNNPEGHVSFDGKAILPPPAWWQESLVTGTLNDKENPSQMVFAGNGIFADTFWQLGIDSLTPSPQAKVLGNLENQIDVSFNRGHAQSWITLTGNLQPSPESAPPYTSKVTLSGTFSDQNLPNTTSNLKQGMNVISFGAGIPLTITKIISQTEFSVSSPQPILAQNPQYLTFANFYADGQTWNAYGKFFHQDDISLGGRAYALSFDDQGGFSSTLTSNWGDSPTKLTITLASWTKM